MPLDPVRSDLASDTVPYNYFTNLVGSWIWASTVSNNQTVLMWRSFEIPDSAQVKEAQLYITADNEFVVYLDGHELGRGDDWHDMFLFNLDELLAPGRHVFAVKAFNSFDYAGLALGLQIELANGRRLEIKSDKKWKVVPDNLNDWQKMTEARTDWTPVTVEVAWGKKPWLSPSQRVRIMPTETLVKVHFWQNGWFQILLLIVCSIVMALSLWLLAQLALRRKESWLLKRERTRIARDIHDDLGAKMTQLVLHCEVAQSELSSDLEAHSRIDVVGRNVREMLSALDEILWAVNPRQDTLREFTSYICNYAEQFLKSTAIRYFLDIPQEIPASAANLPLRRGLFMAIKEALNNAVKHSGATELRLQIRFRRERLVVILVDNGKGFERTTSKGDGSGLTNMTQRLTELGGNCIITSQAGKGCRVEFNVPIKPLHWRLWS